MSGSELLLSRELIGSIVNDAICAETGLGGFTAISGFGPVEGEGLEAACSPLEVGAGTAWRFPLSAVVS